MKNKFFHSMEDNLGYLFRGVQSKAKQRSYTNTDITHQFEQIEKERVETMKSVLENKDVINKLIDDKVGKVYALTKK